MSAEEKQFRRLHYCGTCKTLGSVYGQKARMLLNHDTVFLAEILTSLMDENVQSWQKSYQSYNCLSLPKNEMPLSLQFAAATNVILSEFKIADHISDTRQHRFKFAYRIFSNEFIQAEKSLREWGFPLEKVRNLLETQAKIESKKSNLDELCLPTAETTGIFFKHGANLINRNELQNIAYEIGFAFGKLVYLLDAFEDFEKDEKLNEFNALRAVFGEKGKRKAVSKLLDLENEIITKIDTLPISGTKKQIFSSRLKSNLQKKIQSELPAPVCKPKKQFTFAERFERAKVRAGELTANYSWAKALPIFIFILAFAFISPVHAREAKSARECAELGFNLMFLGSIFGAVLAFPKSMMQGGGNYTPPTPEELEELRKKQQPPQDTGGSGGDGGDSGGWCDSCDCCCDCSGCCDSCDCDCCSGCCDGCDCSCD